MQNDNWAEMIITLLELQDTQGTRTSSIRYLRVSFSVVKRRELVRCM